MGSRKLTSLLLVAGNWAVGTKFRIFDGQKSRKVLTILKQIEVHNAEYSDGRLTASGESWHWQNRMGGTILAPSREYKYEIMTIFIRSH